MKTKHLLHLLIGAALLFSFAACNDDDKVDEDWRDANIEAYKKITKDPSFKELKTETGPSGVFYKVLKNGEGTEHPIQTSSVKVLYKGLYYDGTVFDPGTSGNDVPMEMATDGVVRGFGFALQNMVVGDKWEIWIPYYLGYGASGKIDPYYGTVLLKGYTTLNFELELVEFNQHPQ
jgi:FKBP-type peptidyl-prolyl cis-trans isomerase